jgi:putative ABC transport system substrate-binding protein
VFADPVLANHPERIAKLAAGANLPSISTYRDYAEAGGLMSYGNDLHEGPKGAAAYIDKILRGSKPGDLPVQRATKFSFVINLKAAKTLGLTIAQPLLARADELLQ